MFCCSSKGRSFEQKKQAQTDCNTLKIMGSIIPALAREPWSVVFSNSFIPYLWYMREEIKNKFSSIRELCESHAVKELYLFGSATDKNALDINDFDFTVLFMSDLDPLLRGEFYFSLKSQLEKLLERSVDLVSYSTIRNPVFKQAVDESKLKIYAA